MAKECSGVEFCRQVSCMILSVLEVSTPKLWLVEGGIRIPAHLRRKIGFAGFSSISLCLELSEGMMVKLRWMDPFCIDCDHTMRCDARCRSKNRIPGTLVTGIDQVGSTRKHICRSASR